MTDDQIIQLLKEIDMCTHTYDNGMHIITTYDITKMRRFAERISAVEREACAKVCESEAAKLGQSREALAIGVCAAAIRARGET